MFDYCGKSVDVNFVQKLIEGNEDGDGGVDVNMINDEVGLPNLFKSKTKFPLILIFLERGYFDIPCCLSQSS